MLLRIFQRFPKRSFSLRKKSLVTPRWFSSLQRLFSSILTHRFVQESRFQRGVQFQEEKIPRRDLNRLAKFPNRNSSWSIHDHSKGQITLDFSTVDDDVKDSKHLGKGLLASPGWKLVEGKYWREIPSRRSFRAKQKHEERGDHGLCTRQTEKEVWWNSIEKLKYKTTSRSSSSVSTSVFYNFASVMRNAWIPPGYSQAAFRIFLDRDWTKEYTRGSLWIRETTGPVARRRTNAQSYGSWIRHRTLISFRGSRMVSFASQGLRGRAFCNVSNFEDF